MISLFFLLISLTALFESPSLISHLNKHVLLRFFPSSYSNVPYTRICTFFASFTFPNRQRAVSYLPFTAEYIELMDLIEAVTIELRLRNGTGSANTGTEKEVMGMYACAVHFEFLGRMLRFRVLRGYLY